MQGIAFEKKENGYEVKAPGFIIVIGGDSCGGVYVNYTGQVPHKLKRMLDKNKHLFVSVELAKSLVYNELSRL